LADDKRGKYDEMDYGDEINDHEEKRYKLEAYGQYEEEEAEEEDQESSFDPPHVVPLAKDFSKRANRGNRMSALVDKAMEEDDEDDFWGGIGKDFFGVDDEEEEAASKSFKEDDVSDRSAGVDSFDSDFGRDDEESEDEQQPNKRRKYDDEDQ
jgi:hypothetical protein